MRASAMVSIVPSVEELFANDNVHGITMKPKPCKRFLDESACKFASCPPAQNWFDRLTPKSPALDRRRYKSGLPSHSH